MRWIAIAALTIVAIVRTNASSESNGCVISHIPREPVNSSALAAVGYSKHLHALEVEFVNGAIYRYLDVPPQIYRGLMDASSKTRFYDEHVRGHFQSVHVARSPRH